MWLSGGVLDIPGTGILIDWVVVFGMGGRGYIYEPHCAMQSAVGGGRGGETTKLHLPEAFAEMSLCRSCYH